MRAQRTFSSRHSLYYLRKSSKIFVILPCTVYVNENKKFEFEQTKSFMHQTLHGLQYYSFTNLLIVTTSQCTFWNLFLKWGYLFEKNGHYVVGCKVFFLYNLVSDKRRMCIKTDFKYRCVEDSINQHICSNSKYFFHSSLLWFLLGINIYSRVYL